MSRRHPQTKPFTIHNHCPFSRIPRTKPIMTHRNLHLRCGASHHPKPVSGTGETDGDIMILLWLHRGTDSITCRLLLEWYVAGVCQSNDDLNFEKCSFDSYHTRNACINTEGGGGVEDILFLLSLTHVVWIFPLTTSNLQLQCSSLVFVALMLFAGWFHYHKATPN
jgi:hypothetical protein